MDIKLFKNQLFSKAYNFGFSDFEVYFSSSKSVKVSVFKGEIENFKNSENGGVSFRGIFNGKMGYSYSEKVHPSIIDDLLISAKQNSTIIDDLEEEEIFSGSKVYPNLQTFYEPLQYISSKDLINSCINMEKAALSFSDKIFSCNYCSVGKVYSYTYIANSNGLELDKKENYIYAFLNTLAKEGNHIKSGSATFVGFDFDKFDPVSLASESALKAIKSLGATSLVSGKYNVIFQNDAFAELFSCFINSFSAEFVQKGFSLLKGKLNSLVFSPLITILEDPLKVDGVASSPFDSEGVACFSKTIVEKGVLKTFLYNLKSAKKDNVKSTGNGFKSNFKSPVSTDVTNFFIQNGTISKDDLICSVKNGVLITEISGLHSGINSISGDFSLLAQGFLIENSTITTPIEQITVSGNFFNILENVVSISDDLKFLDSGVGAPSIFVGKLDISGEN